LKKYKQQAARLPEERENMLKQGKVEAALWENGCPFCGDIAVDFGGGSYLCNDPACLANDMSDQEIKQELAEREAFWADWHKKHS
jgi:hypothetical protein